MVEDVWEIGVRVKGRVLSKGGEETKDIITTNLGPGVISVLVQLGLCVNLFFTFPIMMNPVNEVMERRFFGSRYCLWLRWMMVLIISLVALLVPNFADFLSLVGSSVCVALEDERMVYLDQQHFGRNEQVVVLVVEG